LKKNFLDVLAEHRPDILCVQETKAEPSQVGDVFPAEYKAYWDSAEKKGYSGTLILTRHEPLKVMTGIGVPEHDREGRVVALEFEDYHLVTVYTPNAQDELQRLDYRTRKWDVAFLNRMIQLDALKPVIFCGDLNVSHKEIDLARPKANRQNAGFTDEERAGFDNILAAGFYDSFRAYNEQPRQYTWWSYRAGAREKNIGWRLDYFCVSEKLRARVSNAFILPEIYGSDHCPVGLIFDA
ncbi:MAG: exodeoxyribonuclease III, partial [Verrucomicrobia bacterium]|nr:exodeoxyribonuclease III [Verrucomicrobiota bacterium]